MTLSLSPQLFPPPHVCYNDTYWTVAGILVTLTLCLTVVTNMWMLLVTWNAMTTRINPYFFASLAMSDLLTGLFVLPFHLSFVIQSEHADPSYAACTFSGLMFHVLQTISLFSFFALTLDRFISVEYPFQYHTLLTRKVNVISLVLIWSIPTVLYGAIPATGLGSYVYKCWQSMCNLGVDMNMRYLTFLMLFSVIVFLATYAINGRIFYIAHQQRTKQIMLQFQDGTGDRLRFVAKVKVARSITMALGLFTLCWGPYYTALFSAVLFGTITTPLSEFILLWIAMSNSYMNFFVFLATYRSFRLHFLRLIGWRNLIGQDDASTMSTS